MSKPKGKGPMVEQRVLRFDHALKVTSDDIVQLDSLLHDHVGAVRWMAECSDATEVLLGEVKEVLAFENLPHRYLIALRAVAVGTSGRASIEFGGWVSRGRVRLSDMTLETCDTLVLNLERRFQAMKPWDSLLRRMERGFTLSFSFFAVLAFFLLPHLLWGHVSCAGVETYTEEWARNNPRPPTSHNLPYIFLFIPLGLLFGLMDGLTRLVNYCLPSIVYGWGHRYTIVQAREAFFYGILVVTIGIGILIQILF